MKKRICSFFCMTVLLMTVVFCLPALAAGENLWYDGGFDNVTVNGELMAQDDDYRDFVGTWANKIFTDTETGNKYMALAGSSAGQPVVKNKQSLGLSTTKTYTLSVDLKNETAGTPSYLQINYHATTGSEAFWNCTNLTTFAATDEWDTYEIELPVTANYIYMRAYNGAEGSGSGWILVDNISIVASAETEVNMGGIWPDSGFDLLPFSNANISADDDFRIYSQKNWQTKALIESNGNKYVRMRGDGDGNPMLRNKTAFEVDTTKKHVVSFKVAETGGASMEAKVYVYFSNDAITGGYELIDAAKAGTVTTINYHVPADTAGTEGTDTTAAPAWETVTYTIPVGVDFKYVYFLVPTGQLGIDDISITPVEPAAQETILPLISLASPVANAAPQNTVEGTGYTGTVTWAPTVTGKFDYETVYTATVTIATETGYTTTGIDANGYTVLGASSVVNEKDSDTLIVTFPPTGKKIVTQTKVYEPYTLSYNSNHRDTGWYRSGPHAGWVLDNRGGPDMDINSIDYNVIKDISTKEATSFYKNLNKVDEGVVTLETAFKITSGCDGLKLRFTDEDGKTVYSLETMSGSFKVLQAGGTYRTLCTVPSTYRTSNVRVVVKLDFENKVAHTYINDTYYDTDDLLSDNIMRFAYMTDEESTITVNLTSTTKITANYYIHDDFLYYTSSTATLPFGWTSSNRTYANVKSQEGHVSNNATLTKLLDSAFSGKVAFEGIFYANTGAKGAFELLDIDGNSVIDLTIDGTDFTSSSTVVYSNYSKNIWNRFRIEADLVNHKAIVKINGRALKNGQNDLYIDLPANFDEVAGIKISSNSTTEIIFDDLKLFSIVEHDDYVPVPVLPAKDKYSVGINVCPLWSYESTHTWGNIAPFEEFRPVLGYYDEGNPEVADWEIKMLAEHGVDFQAFCWYADKGNGPLKHQTHSMALHDGYMNAKYSDMMKYAIIWEARSGAVPSSMQDVYDYFVPYWIENYFKDDRYMTVDGNLIMYIYDYGTYIHHGICGSDFTNTKTLFTTIKSMVQEATGKPLVILSVMPEAAGSTYLRSAGLDGVSAYHWNADGASWEYTKEGIIAAADLAKSKSTWTVPTISTGFNNLPWRDGERNPNMSVEDFKTGLNWIKNTFLKTYSNYTRANWQKNLVMLSNWNEYGEGTYIMPSGLNGFGYLEAVREVFTDGSNADTHTDYVLTEAQLARLGKNYPQYFKPIRRTFDENEIAKNTASGVDGKLYVDGTLIQSSKTASILPEKAASGAIYFPFDAYWINSEDDATSIAHFLKLHYEWDWDWENGKLTLYGNNDTYAEFTVGSATVEYHGGTITLPDAIYMRDGYPMLHMETVCGIFGYKYAYAENNLYISTVLDETTGTSPAVVAAGLKDTTSEVQSLAFAGYVADDTLTGFGFEISSESGKTIVVDTTDMEVATNGEFCDLNDLEGNFYIVSVNGIPERHFDCNITVRAYAIFDNQVVYSEAVTANVNDVLNSVN